MASNDNQRLMPLHTIITEFENSFGAGRVRTHDLRLIEDQGGNYTTIALSSDE
jgi:hypothetical protein